MKTDQFARFVPLILLGCAATALTPSARDEQEGWTGDELNNCEINIRREESQIVMQQAFNAAAGEVAVSFMLDNQVDLDLQSNAAGFTKLYELDGPNLYHLRIRDWPLSSANDTDVQAVLYDLCTVDENGDPVALWTGTLEATNTFDAAVPPRSLSYSEAASNSSGAKAIEVFVNFRGRGTSFRLQDR